MIGNTVPQEELCAETEVSPKPAELKYRAKSPILRERNLSTTQKFERMETKKHNLICAERCQERVVLLVGSA